MIYVGIYALIYLHTILGEGMDSRDGLPRGALPSGILKMEKYCPGHKVRSPLMCYYCISILDISAHVLLHNWFQGR